MWHNVVSKARFAIITHMKQKNIIIGAIIIGLAIMGRVATAPPRMIDVHEHVQSEDQLKVLIPAMKKHNVKTVFLLGTPMETILLNGQKTFTKYDENNAEILKIANRDPNRFKAFCTIDPRDPKKLVKLKQCMLSGGTGLKLYNGNGFFYDTFKTPLDSRSMFSIYDYAEREGVPIIFHVNGGKYLNEFESVLNRFPNLKINVPHFMLLSSRPNQLIRIFDKYPNLYTDTSFGFIDFTVQGFERFSKQSNLYRELIEKYADRILFATDEVLTNTDGKEADYMKKRLKCYRDFLEKEKYRCPLVDEWYRQKGQEPPEAYSGMNLGKEVLKKIYRENPQRFLED